MVLKAKKQRMQKEKRKSGESDATGGAMHKQRNTIWRGGQEVEKKKKKKAIKKGGNKAASKPTSKWREAFVYQQTASDARWQLGDRTDL